MKEGLTMKNPYFGRLLNYERGAYYEKSVFWQIAYRYGNAV